MSKTKTIMKESIIDGAFAVFRKYGYENLNARSLAREMNCSTQPIYVNFKDMDQVKKIARKLAAERYQEILGEAEKKYKKRGMHNCCGIADSRSIYVQAEKPGISGNKEYKTQWRELCKRDIS